jgi:hypothetical protein
MQFKLQSTGRNSVLKARIFWHFSTRARAMGLQPKGRLLYSPWNFVHARTPFLGVFIGRVNRIYAFRGVYLPPQLCLCASPIG